MDVRRRAFMAAAALVGVAGFPASRFARADQFGAEEAHVVGESRFANVNGVRLHYLIAGSGPAVVLLHGWPETSFAWRGTINRLAERFTLIAPDLRGTGRSDRPRSGYDKRTIAADVAGLIDLAAGGRAHLVGHDMGGKAAYMLGLLSPERVSKLVLVDCLAPGTENADALHGGAWHYGFHMARDIPELLTQGHERAYIAAQIRAWSHVKNAVGDEAISEYARHYATPGGMTAGFEFYRALPEDAAAAAALRDRTFEMPVMTIAGRHGVGDKLADAIRLQAPGLISHVVDGAGHFVAEESPKAFCDLLDGFLSG